jgi:hypothetical protein
MKTQEMIDMVRLEANKIASNVYEDFLDEEIEAVLNAEQYRLIKERYHFKSNNKQEGFEMSQKRRDDLRTLIVSNSSLITYTTADTSVYRAYLPSDYMFLVGAMARVYHSNCNDVTATTTQVTSDICSFKLNNPTRDWSNFMIQTSGSVNILSVSGLSNYRFPEDNYAFVEAIKAGVTNSAYTIHWEQYNGIYRPGEIIIARVTPGALQLKYKLSGASYITLAFTLTAATYKTGLENGSISTVPTYMATFDELPQVLNNPFTKSIATRPVVLQHGNYLDVYTDDFISEKISLSYIRKPRRISLTLQQDCELPEHMHYELVRSAVTHLLETMESNRYQTSLNEQNKIE